MGQELSKRIDVVKGTPWKNCASVALASILPEPLTGNEDLMGLAFHNDGTIEYLEGLVRVGLYRQGYCPVTYESDRRPDIMTILREAYKETQENPFVEVFGAMLLDRRIFADPAYIEAMNAYVAEQGYLVDEFDPEEYGSADTRPTLHAFSIVSVNSRAGIKKAGIVDTLDAGWDKRKLPRFVPIKRADKHSMKPNPFYDVYPIISRGIRFEYLDYAHTGIPRSFWDSELRDLDDLSQIVREAGQEYL